MMKTLNLDKLWVEPLCNKRRDRGIFIGKYCLPFCARCTGIHLGSLLYWIYIIIGGSRMSFGTAVILLYPTLIDGVLQYLHGIESTNLRRFVTGLIAGVGSGAIDVMILRFVFRL